MYIQSQQPYEVAISVPTLEMKKQTLYEVKQLVQDHTAGVTKSVFIECQKIQENLKILLR